MLDDDILIGRVCEDRNHEDDQLRDRMIELISTKAQPLPTDHPFVHAALKSCPKIRVDNQLFIGEKPIKFPNEALDMMKAFHEHPALGAHMGRDHLLSSFREMAYNPMDYQMAAKICQQCTVCQTTKNYGKKK